MNFKIAIRLTLLFVIPWNTLFSQTFTNLPNDTIEINGMMEDFHEMTIEQHNITSSSLQLAWEKVSENIPVSWDLNVCDNVICYGTLINNGTMNPVAAGSFGYLIIHCTPHVNYGTATIQYAVWDVNFPALRDTLTYIIHVNPTGIDESADNLPLIYFSDGKIKIAGNKGQYNNLYLFDLNGRIVFQTLLNHQTEIELPPLTSNIYFVRMTGNREAYHRKLHCLE